MHIAYTLIPDWPPLAWLARCRSGHHTVDVLHGPRVEVAPEWFVEAVWDDEYAAAAFDRTDLVFGSGGRARDGTLLFISAGTTVDRLQFLQHGAETWVSNSLPCLLAAVNGGADLTYAKYYEAFKSITLGIHKYQRRIPTSAGPAQLVYVNNLAWDGQSLREVAKPAPIRDFSSFEKYRGFLQASLGRLTENLSAPQRRFPYRWLGTMSSGYDSLTAAVLAKPFGLEEVVSFTEARGGDADGAQDSAGILGLRSTLIARDAWLRTTCPEVPFVAADAKGEDVIFKGIEANLGGRVLLTGYHGGKVWDKNVKASLEDFARGDQSGLSLSEFRLWVGFLNCPLPFFGTRQIRDINAISRSSEMQRWDVGGSYNRPICRRIIEEAGIPREAFGVRKRAASVLLFSRDSFVSPSAYEDFATWLRQNAGAWPKRPSVPPAGSPSRRTFRQQCATIALRIAQPLDKATGSRFRLLQGLCRRLAIVANREPLFQFLFPWAIARAKERYIGGLRRVGFAHAATP